MRRLGQLVLVALIAAGCGSGGGTAQPTGSTSTALSESAQLIQYLGRIEPREKQLDKLRNNVLAAVDGVHVQQPDRTWTRAATRLGTATAGLDRLSVAVLDVKPPPRLKSAHQDLAESIAVLESYVYDVKNALNARIPSLLASAATADSTRMAVLRGTWEAAVTDYARRLGVTLPSWLGGPALSA
jgi:hypothetical protein